MGDNSKHRKANKMTIEKYNNLCARVVTALTLSDNGADLKSRVNNMFDDICELYRDDELNEPEFNSLCGVLKVITKGINASDEIDLLDCSETYHIEKSIESC